MIEEYSNLEEALENCMIKDIDHILIRHSYPNGTRIIPHIHKDADEYVVASQGHFIISSEEVTREFQLDGSTVTVIYYPAGRKHGLQVLGNRLEYLVLRILT